MSEPNKCPFCGASTVRESVGGVVVFRCTTEGDVGVYSTGRPCEIITFTRELESLQAENQKLRAWRDAIVEAMHENAGNLQNPFAYIWQKEWDKLKSEVSDE